MSGRAGYAAKLNYFLLSFASLFLIFWAKQHAQETNLPPLEPFVRMVVNVLYVNLACSYLFLTSDRTARRPSASHWSILALVGLGLCLMLPVFSGDLMEYLIRGRMLVLYHLNPYAHFPSEIPQDLLRPYSVWLDSPDAYGPVFLWIKCLPSMLFPGSVTGMVWAMKFLTLLFLALAIRFFDLLLKSSNLSEPARRLTLFAFSPLVLVAALVDGLNDVVLIAFLLGAVYFLVAGKQDRCFFLWALAFLVKYTAILILPLLLIYSFRVRASGGKTKAVAGLLKALLMAAVLIVLCFAPYWAGPQTFGTLSGLGQRFYSNTFPYLFQEVLSRLGLRVEENVLRLAFLGLYLAVYAGLMFNMLVRKDVSHRTLFRSLAAANLVFYLCLSSPFSYNYLLWALPWLILSEWPADALLSTLYAFMGLFSFFKRINYLFVLFGAVYLAALILRRAAPSRPRSVGAS